MYIKGLFSILFFTISAVNIAGVHFFTAGSDGKLGPVKWAQFPIKVEINASTSDSLSNAEVITELNHAMTQWQSINSASVSFQDVETFISAPEIGIDFRNFIYFDTEDFDEAIIALTYVTSNTSTKEIVDVDMRFNKRHFTFLTDSQKPSEGKRIVLRNVATHEFGHLLGFDHSPLTEQQFGSFSIQESTMFPNFNDKQGTLEQDDISILSFTYPSSSSPYTGTVTGFITNSDFGFSGNPGAHVVAWDYFRNPNTAISSISGITSTGVNLNGFYKIEGLPPGNYVFFIEPFPINHNSGLIQLSSDFDFLNKAPLFKNSFLSLSRSFPKEFWHGQAESELEISTGFSTATFVEINESNQAKRIDFITNTTSIGLELRNSDLQTEKEIIYADGKSNTRLSLLLKDSFSNIIKTDLSSRLELRLTTGSFSSTSTLTRVTPTFINDGSFTYVAELYSSTLPNSVTRLESFINLHLDSQTTPVFFTPLKVAFEKADPLKTSVLYLPDPSKFDQDSLVQPRTDTFADGKEPATLRIIPRFSDESIISVPISTLLSRTFLNAIPSEPSITTFPIVSISGNQYQTTLTNSSPGIIQPIISLDGVFLGNQESIRFSGISTNLSTVQLDINTIHISHPLITTVPFATLSIEPVLRDGSSIKSEILTERIRVVLSEQSGIESTNYIPSPITGPYFTSNSRMHYECTINAGPKVDQVFIRVEIDSQQLSKVETLTFSVGDPNKTEIRTRNNFLLRDSDQIATIEVLPRFSDNTLIDLDISKLLFLSTTLGSLLNNDGDETGDNLPAISPSYAGSGILTAGLRSGETVGDAFITGRIQSIGIQDILQGATVRVVPGNPNLLSVRINDDVIAADAKTVTTMTVTPLFPDGKPIGKSFPASSLTASISEGEFLRKTPFIGNPNLLVLAPAGRDRVSLYSNGDGSFELSIRSTGFSTIAEISFELDNVLSLITKTISYSFTGSADPQQTIVEIENPFLIANGTSSTKINIFPRSPNGEPTILPQTSSIQITATKGLLVGTLVKNPDFSYSREIQSIRTTRRETSIISVFIDGAKISPDRDILLSLLNLDVSTLNPAIGIPDQGIVDGFDTFIMALVIRNIDRFRSLSCLTNIEGEEILCRFDFNQDGLVDFNDLVRFDFNLDGVIDILDLEIVERAYGNQGP